jgi:hypothetical protein
MQARTVVAADSDPSVEAGGFDPADEEGAALDQAVAGDKRTSNLVDGETVGGGEEQAMVRPDDAMFVAVLPRGEEQRSILAAVP